MSTHCLVACKVREHILCSYIHYDGYPSNIGKELLESFSDIDKAVYISGSGDIRSVSEGKLELFDEDDDPDMQYDPNTLDVVFDIFDVAERRFAEYCYYFDEGVWVCSKTIDKQWLNLKDILTKGED